MNGRRPTLWLLAIVVAAAVVGAAIVASARHDAGETGSDTVGFSPSTVVYASAGDEPKKSEALKQAERLTEELTVRPETRKTLGHFAMPQGGEVLLEIARTRGGQTCLIDTSPAGAEGRSCSDARFFEQEHVKWSMTSDGGPERFSELYVSGLAAPDVARLVAVRSDGTTAEVQLNRERAFVFAATADELDRDSLPAGLRAYGRGGRLLESIDIPRMG